MLFLLISAVQTVTITNRTNGKISVNWHVPTHRTDKDNNCSNNDNGIEEKYEFDIVQNRGREGRGSSMGNGRNKTKDEVNFDFQGNTEYLHLSFLLSFYYLHIFSRIIVVFISYSFLLLCYFII